MRLAMPCTSTCWGRDETSCSLFSWSSSRYGRCGDQGQWSSMMSMLRDFISWTFLMSNPWRRDDDLVAFDVRSRL